MHGLPHRLPGMLAQGGTTDSIGTAQNTLSQQWNPGTIPNTAAHFPTKDGSLSGSAAVTTSASSAASAPFTPSLSPVKRGRPAGCPSSILQYQPCTRKVGSTCQLGTSECQHLSTLLAVRIVLTLACGAHHISCRQTAQFSQLLPTEPEWMCKCL